MKNNLAAPGGGLAYTIVPRGERGSPMVVWHPEPVRLDADELVAVHRQVQGEKKDRADAMDWLQGYLLDGPQRASHVRQTRNSKESATVHCGGHSRISMARRGR